MIECSRILYTSEHQVRQSSSQHQVRQSVYLRAPSQCVYLYISQHQVSLSVCAGGGGGWICLSLSLSHHTHIHTHNYFFNSILISPCLALGHLSTLLWISWLNFPTLNNCLVWGVIFHYHQPWYHPGSKVPGAQALIHRMFPQLPNLSSIGSFMMTIPSSYQSPPFFSPMFSGLNDRTSNVFMHVKHVFHHWATPQHPSLL